MSQRINEKQKTWPQQISNGFTLLLVLKTIENIVVISAFIAMVQM